MNNTDIRQEIRDAGIKIWEVAERYGCTDGNFSRKLRKEFSDSEKEKVRAIIKEIKGEEESCRTPE